MDMMNLGRKQSVIIVGVLYSHLRIKGIGRIVRKLGISNKFGGKTNLPGGSNDVSKVKFTECEIDN